MVAVLALRVPVGDGLARRLIATNHELDLVFDDHPHPGADLPGVGRLGDDVVLPDTVDVAKSGARVGERE